LVALAGGRLANEDLFNLRKLALGLGGESVLYSSMAGGDLVAQIGLPPGSNLGEMGAGAETEPPDVILVVGSDLEEEAPVWWLRLKQAAQRGAKLIVLNSRRTKLDRAASFSLRYPFGLAAGAVLALVNALSPKRPALPESLNEFARSPQLQEAAKAFAESKNAIVLYGSDGMGLPETAALAQACANLLLITDHLGRPNNGLLGVWPHANDQGAWELGWRPSEDLMDMLNQAGALYIAAADPVGDDPAYQPVFGGQKFVVVQDLFLTRTARLADVVLPAQSWTEREGSYTSGERRVQRFYPALQSTKMVPVKVGALGTRAAAVLTHSTPLLEGPQADYAIPVLIAELIEAENVGAEKLTSEAFGRDGLTRISAATVFSRIGAEIPVFKGLDYQKLAEVQAQWPLVGRGDLYYGGTSYENAQGLGVQLEPAQNGASLLAWPQVSDFKLPMLGLMAFPITRLYDRGATLMPSKLLHARIGEPYVVLNEADAGRLKINNGAMVRVTFNASGQSAIIQARLDPELPERVALVPRSFGLPISGPAQVEIKLAV
jgi:NADH-quinone oxidoreductase subunit G